jgi:diguanylate cyclase (GGDEF)-like protein
MAADLSMILYTFFSVFRARKRLERKAFAVIVLFGILPLSFGILQIAFSGLPLVWNSVALAVIFVYIFMETQKEIRDYLTGLPNRQQIDDMIVSRMMDAERKGGFSLIMLDMDGFKAINDQYGHKEGDRALVRLAEILKRAVKGIDKVARFGGDEFMILLEDGRAEKANEVIKRLQDSLEAENASGCRPYALSVSAGFSVYSSTCGRSFHDLVNSADQDMYMRKQAKARGRSSAP